MTDWIMVIITAIYVIATIIICVSNYRSSNLARESNEINLKSKIVEIEQSRLIETKNAIDNFVKNASLGFQFTNQITNNLIDAKDREASIRIIAIKDSFQLFKRCILVDNDVDKYEYQRVLNCAQCFYTTSIDICEWMNKEYDGSESEDEMKKRLQKVVEVQSHFFEAKEQYILSREEKISKVLLGNLSLSEIKKLYSNNCRNYKNN